MKMMMVGDDDDDDEDEDEDYGSDDDDDDDDEDDGDDDRFWASPNFELKDTLTGHPGLISFVHVCITIFSSSCFIHIYGVQLFDFPFKGGIQGQEEQ